MEKTFLPIAFLRGEFLPFGEANLSIATHALHYGTGAFGGMRSIPDPKNPDTMLLFRPMDHARRLSKSAKFLGYEISPEHIYMTICTFLQKNKPTKPIYMRPLVYTSDLDISPRLHDIEKDFLLYGIELGDYLSSEGVSCCFSSWMRQADVSFPLRGKITGGYITSALTKTEAKNRGFDEAIMMNHQGKVSEGSGMNIFLVRNGKIITPSVDQDILEGITRDSVIQIATSLGYEVIERPVDKTELLIADEVWLTGTAARITPVFRIEQYDLPTDRPIMTAIKNRFDLVVQGDDEEFKGWIERVTF
ncbi:branched-chain amino acid transaminase [Candidatus Gracilibacteria bacterium]|nr:branched-chain amino acid transaminase [Candidatus Gracilibacteria bacterium]